MQRTVRSCDIIVIAKTTRYSRSGYWKKAVFPPSSKLKKFPRTRFTCSVALFALLAHVHVGSFMKQNLARAFRVTISLPKADTVTQKFTEVLVQAPDLETTGSRFSAMADISCLERNSGLIMRNSFHQGTRSLSDVNVKRHLRKGKLTSNSSDWRIQHLKQISWPARIVIHCLFNRLLYFLTVYIQLAYFFERSYRSPVNGAATHLQHT
ncbi:hypothetical protein B0H11DRAFT_1899545 [Mycena galericulata]|nr:hypothetical protein B0H11DRAFT_1899545 [Mycena galericulata]